MAIELKGTEELIKKLNTLENFQQWGKQPLESSVDIVHKLAQEQPPKAPGAFSRLATPGQKRAYWAKVASGEARHSEASGYIRSNQLKNSWTKKVETVTRGLRGIVENLTDYGHFVQGRFRQPFHKVSGWLTDDELAQKAQTPVEKGWAAAIDKVLKP
ncbi:MAG: hypothetical protein ACE5FD_07035 [Anaerolineae bacterium]